MTKKTLIAGAIGLALAFGCEDEPEGATYQQQEEITPDPYAMERTETELEEQARLNEQPAGQAQPQEEPDPFGEPVVGQEPEGTELTQGQPMSRRSGNDFNQTLRTLRRELTNADYVIAGVVPLQAQQQRQQQQQEPGAAKPEGSLRAELILFASQNALGDVQGDPLTILASPTAILVYEDQMTGDVLVGFQDPELVHIVDASIGTGEQPQGMQGQQPQGMQGQQPQGTQGQQQPQQPQQPQGTQDTQQPQGTTPPAGLDQPEAMEEEQELDY